MQKNKNINDNLKYIVNHFYIDINSALKEQETAHINIETEPTKNELLTFKYPTKQGNMIYMHSKYDPLKEVNRFLDGLDFSLPSLYIVYGIGMGYHIDELLKRIAPGSKILVFEKDIKLLLNYAKYNSVHDKLIKNKVFLFAGKEEDMLSILSQYIMSYDILALTTNMVPVVLPSYEKIYGMDWLKDFNKLVADVLLHGHFLLGNDVEDTIIGLRNNFRNILDVIISPSVKTLKNQYENKPAIIVSAGPSLDKNIKDLKEAQGKALILATDATITALKKHNITPDTVSSIERVDSTYQAFYKDKEIDEKTIFLGPPMIKSDILDTIKGKKLFLLKEKEPINEWINEIVEDERLIYMGTSSAHICFSFAKYLGVNPIIFVGQDLAYTKEGITHADDVEIKQKREEYEFWVEGINGEIFPTSLAFKNFLTWLETEIGKDKSSREYIDATEGGAYIRGTKVMTLKETIDRYCKEETTPLGQLVSEEKHIKGKIPKLIDKIIEKKKGFQNFKDFLHKEIELFMSKEKLFCQKNEISRKELKKIFDLFKRLELLKEEIGKDQMITFFCQGLYVSHKTKMNKIPWKNDVDTANEILNIYIDMLEAMHRTCILVEEEFDHIVEELEQYNIKVISFTITVDEKDDK